MDEDGQVVQSANISFLMFAVKNTWNVAQKMLARSWNAWLSGKALDKHAQDPELHSQHHIHKQSNGTKCLAGK